jgi:hypothetical protein
MEMHGCTIFGESSWHSSIFFWTFLTWVENFINCKKEEEKELYSYLCKTNVKKVFSCPPLEVPSEFDGLQQEFHSDFVPLYANNAHVFWSIVAICIELLWIKLLFHITHTSKGFSSFFSLTFFDKVFFPLGPINEFITLSLEPHDPH